MHNALGIDLGYGRYRNVGSARKFVFGMGLTALVGVLLLDATASLLDLPEDSGKWSRLLSASAMFCIGLSFLMWCVDELVFTPLALGEWTIESLVPFRWTREYRTLLRVAQANDAARNSSSILSGGDFVGFSGFIIDQINDQNAANQEETEQHSNFVSTHNQTNPETFCDRKKQTEVSIIGKTFSALTLKKQKNKETERECLIDKNRIKSAPMAFRRSTLSAEERLAMQRRIADLEEQSTSYQQNTTEDMPKLETKNITRLPRMLSIFSKPKTDLQVNPSSVEVHGMIRNKKGVTQI